MDTGLLALLAASIFVLRKFFHKCKCLEDNITSLQSVIRKTEDDVEEKRRASLELDRKLDETLDSLSEQNNKLEDIQGAIGNLYDLTNNCHIKIKRAVEEIDTNLTNLADILDKFSINKIGQIDIAIEDLRYHTKHELNPYMRKSDEVNTLQKTHENIQELADTISKEFTECHRKLAATSEALIEHRDQYARDRRHQFPNQHRPFGRDTRSVRGLQRQAEYYARCGSHGLEARPARRDYGPVRPDPDSRPLINAAYEDNFEY